MFLSKLWILHSILVSSRCLLLLGLVQSSWLFSSWLPWVCPCPFSLPGGAARFPVTGWSWWQLQVRQLLWLFILREITAQLTLLCQQWVLSIAACYKWPDRVGCPRGVFQQFMKLLKNKVYSRRADMSLNIMGLGNSLYKTLRQIHYINYECSKWYARCQRSYLFTLVLKITLIENNLCIITYFESWVY